MQLLQIRRYLMPFTGSELFFKIASRIERLAARAQGKGYGSLSMGNEVSNLLSTLSDPPVLAIDIGGNIGDYTAELRKINSELEIHTFEPSGLNVSKLNSRFKSDKLIQIIPFALSDNAGQTTLFSDVSGSGMASLTKRKLDHFNIAFQTEEKIQTIRFEEYWRSNLGSRSLDIVKIDIEGHEFAALNGFGSALDASKVIQFEFGGTDIDTRVFFRDFWYFFKDHGFLIYRYTPFGLQPITKYTEDLECFMYTNFVAVNISSN